eukprot:gene19473-biopygen11530
MQFGRQKTGIGVRWYPSGVGYGSLPAPPGSRKFRDLIDFDAWWTTKPPPPLHSVTDVQTGSCRAAASLGTRDRQFSPSARFRLRVAETITHIYSGSKANAPGPSGGRGRSDAEGEHLAATKPVLVPVGTPSGSDQAPWRYPQEVGISEILLDFCAWWIPQDPPYRSIPRPIQP